MKSRFKTFVGTSLSNIVLLLGLLLFSQNLFAQALSILQGASNESSAQFSILVPKGSDFSVTVNNQEPSWRKQVDDETSEWSVLKLEFSGLSLGRTYQLLVLSERGEVIDEREFQTFDSTNRYPKIALASCMVDWLHNESNWQQMKSLSPDLIILLGDTTYVDIAGPLDLISRPEPSQLNHWKRYAETRLTLDLYRWKKLVPVLALMDDHDYGLNNADSSFVLKDRANFVFDTFFAQRGEKPLFEMGPGQSFKADLFGLSFLFLDGRNFRTQDRILGPEQLKWMVDLTLKERTLILSGSQFFGAYLKKDSYEGLFSENFKEFIDFLKDFRTQFVFASGDIHFSELMRIEESQLGYPTYEITSSSIHSFTVPGGHILRAKNPRRIPGKVTSTHNFVTLDLDTSNFDNWQVRSHGWRGQDLFESTLNFSPANFSCSQLLTGPSRPKSSLPDL